MKKLISLILCTILLSLNTVCVTASENNIEGLQECLDALWMKNYYTEEQFDEMREKWKADFTEEFWRTPWEIRHIMETRYVKYDDAEDELILTTACG